LPQFKCVPLKAAEAPSSSSLHCLGGINCIIPLIIGIAVPWCNW
jgi:hypothetical protein